MEDSYVLQLLKPKFKDFHLSFCGYAECEPLHSYGLDLGGQKLLDSCGIWD